VGDPVGWFEPLYAQARGRADAIPWAELTPHPYLVDWLDDPPLPPTGDQAIVVGCGLGDDAAAVAQRGFAVTAFDVSATAVDWAARRFRDLPIDWRTHDLLALPPDLGQAFDLVVEVRTVQSLPGVVRDAAMQAIGGLVAPGGTLVAVALMATSDEVARATTGPPWPQSPSELAAYQAAGLERVHLEHAAPGSDGTIEVRLTFRRAPSR